MKRIKLSMNVIDRRPNNILELDKNQVSVLEIDFKEDDSEFGIKKTDFESRIKKALGEIKDKESKTMNIRFSKDYASVETKKKTPSSYVSDRKWQSFHSVDFSLASLADEKEEGSKSSGSYAFVVPWSSKRKYIILYFTEDQFKDLLTRKDKAGSFSDYKNAKGDDYRKYIFYFTHRLDDEVIIEKVSLYKRIKSIFQYVFSKF